jgi:hypothetical protein
MSNTLLTIDMITRATLEVAHEKLSFLGTIDRSYDDSYAKGGAKIGDTLRVRLPTQYTRRTGSRVMDVQDAVEVKADVTVATQDGVDMKFNSTELALSLDEFTKRHIEPAVSVLVAGVEGDVLTDMTKSIYNLTGSAGTVVGSSSGDISAITNARAKLNQYLAPKDGNRAVQFDSVTMGAIVNGNKALFHDSSQIREAFREGFISRNAMADWYENEKTWTMTNSDDVAGEVDESAATNFTEGTTTIHVDGLGTTIKKGMVFEWEGLYAVHPETKQAYSHLQQFVVTNVDGSVTSNEIDITFSPAIYTTGARKNVATSTGADVTWTFTGQDGKNIAFVGSASTAYRQNLMYHRDFATFVTADLPLMDDASKCVRRVKDGLSVRLWQASDIRNDELLTRLDILYGWKVLRPEWACRITN